MLLLLLLLSPSRRRRLVAALPSLSMVLTQIDESMREDDIALQLPELKKLPRVLKEKREVGNECGAKGGGVGDVL
ncbi:hypothetical protein Droror1_Dr00027061 [Drosera rotundifolia]